MKMDEKTLKMVVRKLVDLNVLNVLDDHLEEMEDNEKIEMLSYLLSHFSDDYHTTYTD